MGSNGCGGRSGNDGRGGSVLGGVGMKQEGKGVKRRKLLFIDWSKGKELPECWGTWFADGMEGECRCMEYEDRKSMGAWVRPAGENKTESTLVGSVECGERSVDTIQLNESF